MISTLLKCFDDGLPVASHFSRGRRLKHLIQRKSAPAVAQDMP